MRYIIGDAGNVERLYWAVKTASEVQAEDLQTLCEIYIRKYAEASSVGRRKRGFLKSSWRSAEPHFSFARELDLLDWGERDLWRLTFGPGRSFLRLWEGLGGLPPRNLLLAQLLERDRSFLMPFLIRLLEARYDFSAGRFLGLSKIAGEAWDEAWSVHGRELELLDPPFLGPKDIKDRTLLHHAMARVRMLNTTEGLGLNMEQTMRLTEQFDQFRDSAQLPSDVFFRIGTALTGRRPSPIDGENLSEKVLEAHSALQRAGYASGYGILLYINETSLPDLALDRNTYELHVRKKIPFSVRASFRRDDFLVAVEKREEAAVR
jgi:hypothetical protein